ncbi:MAG TPA: hypothetical protein VGM37_19325 [Armatimonadota bacterium]|jgi:ribosomal protein S6
MPVRPYAVTYVIDPNMSPERAVSLVERFRAQAHALGAAELRVYATRCDEAIGHLHVVMSFRCAAGAAAELKHALDSAEGVHRASVHLLPEIPPGRPAADTARSLFGLGGDDPTRP